MSAPRGYVTALFGCIGLTLLAAVLLNTTVNPWRVTPTPWSAEKLDPYRDISSQIRTGKAGIVRPSLPVSVSENMPRAAKCGWRTASSSEDSRISPRPAVGRRSGAGRHSQYR